MTSGRVTEAVDVEKSAERPMAVFSLPVVLLSSAAVAVGRVADASGIAIERIKTGGRVEASGGEAEKRIIALSGVLVGIASVRCGRYRLRSR